MSDDTQAHQPLGETAKRTRRFAVRGGLLSLGAALVAIIAIGHGAAKNDVGREQAGGALQQQQHPLFPPDVPLKPEPREVVGNLGGLRVTFPRDFVDNVEYDGDPGFGEKRQGPIPKRTHESSFTSLGFDVRYPDFQVLTGKERDADQRRYTIYTTPWISVSITAGSIFGDGQFLERSVAGMNSDPKFQYEKLPQPQFGLDVYTPTTVDKSKRFMNPETRTFGNDRRDRDVFIYRGLAGRVETYIECSNRQHRAAPCQHFFFMDDSLKIKLTAHYRRGQLEYWKEIQSSIIAVILSFKNP